MRIRDPGWKKVGSGIQDKHPRSATLVPAVAGVHLVASFPALAGVPAVATIPAVTDNQ